MFAAVVVAGLLGLVVTAALERRGEAFTLGVVPSAQVAQVRPGGELCQRPIEVVSTFRGVAMQLGTPSRQGPAFLLEVRDTRTKASIARAEVAEGYRDNSPATVTLSRAVPEGRRVELCVRNTARRGRVAPYGNGGVSNRTSGAFLNGRPVEGDVSAVFLREEEAGVLALVPEVVERSALFHGSWASPAAYWILLAILLLGPACALAFAVRAATRGTA